MRYLLKFRWMWIFPWIKGSWHACSMWDKFWWLNWFWQFLCEGLPSFNPKGICHSHTWFCILWERGASFAWDASPENSVNFYICFCVALLHSVPYFFFLYQSLSSSLSTVFDVISVVLYVRLTRQYFFL